MAIGLVFTANSNKFDYKTQLTRTCTCAPWQRKLAKIQLHAHGLTSGGRISDDVVGSEMTWQVLRPDRELILRQNKRENMV